MSDLVVSWIRTVVPAVVGAALVWVESRLGVDIDDAQIASAATVVAAALWHWLARRAEARWPAAGWLLGVPRPPTYRR